MKKYLPLIITVFILYITLCSACVTGIYFSMESQDEKAPAAVEIQSPPPGGASSNFTTYWSRLFKGADPIAFVHDGTWYVFVTGNVAYTSTDAKTWKRHVGFLNDGFIWAPHVHQVGDDWYMIYSVGPTPLRIAKSSSKTPLGPYVKHAELGAYLIDPYLFADDDGSLILFATDSNPSTNRGIFRTIIKPDMKTIGPWKYVFGKSDDPTSVHIVEGSNFFKTPEGWVVSYSSYPYQSPLYDTRTAFAPSLDGPWTFHGKKLFGPISKNGQVFSGIGHGSYVSLGGNEYIYFLHTHDSGPDDRSVFAIRATLQGTTFVYDRN